MSGRRACLTLSVFMFLGTAFLFSGCPTPPKPTPPLTSLEPIPLSFTPLPVVPPPVQNPVETVVISSSSEPKPVRDFSNAVLPEEKLQFPSGKLPLSSWASLCGFTDIRWVPNANPPMVELISTEGNLTLYLGQRFAKWNGISLGLGFPAVSERGQVVVHSIDVMKNFYPLGIGMLSIPKQTRVLVIDPGHGGADPGSRGSTRSALEKDLALDWALRVERLLSNSSWRVVLTRRDDRDIPLMERVAVAESNRADLFVSLHFNSVETSGNRNSDEAGIETYCLTPAGAPSNVTRNFEDDQRRVYPNNEFDSQNLLLATRMQSHMIAATSRKDRGVRRARFMTVVREQRRPAVLVEGGFLSNPTELNMILKPEFREQMARAVCSALPD